MTGTARFCFREQSATSECRCLISNNGSTMLFSDRKRIHKCFEFIYFLRLLMEMKKCVLFPAPTQLSSVQTAKLREGKIIRLLMPD